MSQRLRQLFLTTICLGMAVPALAQNGPSGQVNKFENASGPVTLSYGAKAEPEGRFLDYATNTSGPNSWLQAGPPQAGSFRVKSEHSEFSPRARQSDSSDVRLSTSVRTSVLCPIRINKPLQSGLRARLREDALDAQVLQTGALVSQRTDSLQSEPASVLPHRRRWDVFRSEVISIRFVTGSVLGGTIEHLAGSPGALDRDMRGYLARVGTNAASRLTYVGVRHGVSAAFSFRLESPEPKGPLGARLRQAALQALTIRTASGQRVPAVAEMAGTYGAILTRGRLYYGQWRPGPAATSTAVAIGFKVVWATGSELVEAL